jgi:lipoprotein
MSHRFSTIVVTSLAALSLGLSACSSTIPANPSPADTVAPGLTQSTGDAPGGTSDLASKLLVGQVAGATLTQVQVHEDATSPFPDLENPYYDSDADHKIEPAGCEATGIEQLLVGSEGKTENEGVRVALGTGTSSPRKHKDYANKCAEITNHLTETPTHDSIQTQQIPAIDGVIDVVATKTQHGFVGTEGDAGFSTYLITGNVGNINVTVQTYPSQTDTSAGKEASLDTAVKIFQAQVKKLTGSSGSTGSTEGSTTPAPQTPPASSQESSAPSQNTSNQDLSSKLISGSVAGFSLAPMESPSPLAAISNSFYEAMEHNINPDGCDQTGLDNLTAGTEGSHGTIHARVALGTDTSSPQKHKQYAQKCSTITGSVNGEAIFEYVKLEEAPAVNGATNIVATSMSGSTPNTDEIGPKSYLITGNVGNVNVVVHMFPLEDDGQEPSFADAVALFKAQVEKLNS